MQISFLSNSDKAGAASDTYKCLNEGTVCMFLILEIAFECCCLAKIFVMSRVRSANAYQHVSDFDKGQIVAYRDCGLSYRSIAARIDRDPMIVSLLFALTAL
ncbi:hypothetical protein TNCV_2590991 [Trichonephila clavipes]|nr:hypothetical protein TNCV_2590991 [Trichonephila clavipes]